MTRYPGCIVVATVCLVAATALTAAERPASYRNLKFPPLGEVKIPKIETATLGNGLRIYLLEDHELPLVRGTALVRTGSLLDPAEKTGLASLAATVMRSGGTKALSGDELDERLENVAASVESSAGGSSASVSFSCLKENAEDVLRVFHDVLIAPEFRAGKIDVAKQQMRSAILRRNDDAAALGAREFARILYGPDSAYGRRIEFATLDRITREDLVAFHTRYYFPKNAMLTIAGDFSTAEMKARIEKLFGDWTAEQGPAPEFPQVSAKAAPAVYVATKPDVTQTFFYVGQLGGTLRDKDAAALDVMSDILGGGFSSRLVRRVRTELGLAYSIDADWDADYLHPGTFRISGSTQSKSTTEALEAALDEVKRIRESEVTDEELQTAKDIVRNSFVFHFDKPSKTLNRLATYEYYGYPKDFIEQYRKAVDAVTRADVLRVARERLQPERFTIVAVGNPPDFGKPLTALMRRIEKLEVSEPRQEDRGQETGDRRRELGGALLERARAAMGGTAAFEAVKDYSVSSTVALRTPGGEMKAGQTTRVLLPSTLRQDQDLPFGKVVAYYDGKAGWLHTPQGPMPMPEAVLKQVRMELFRAPIPLLLSDRDPSRTVSATGETQVRISSVQGDVAVTIDFDPQTGLPVRESYSGIGGAGPTRLSETYADWGQAGGLKLPYRIGIQQDGKDTGETTVREWTINSGLKAEELSARPAVVPAPLQAPAKPQIP